MAGDLNLKARFPLLRPRDALSFIKILFILLVNIFCRKESVSPRNLAAIKYLF